MKKFLALLLVVSGLSAIALTTAGCPAEEEHDHDHSDDDDSAA